MKRAIISLPVALALLFLLFFASTMPKAATATRVADRRATFVVNFVPAKTSNELSDIRSNRSANIIRTKTDVDRILRDYKSPLSLLSAKDLSDFKSKLVERTGVGIVSLQYGVVQSKLSEKDFVNLMAMFGFDVKEGFWGLSRDPKIVNQIRASSASDTPVMDHDGYYCSGPYTCTKKDGYICTSNC